MKCPKCSFNSFESQDRCKKCGKDLSAFKAGYSIRPLVMPKKPETEEPTPDDMALTAAPAASPPQDEAAAPAAIATVATVTAVAASESEPDEFVFDTTPFEPTPIREPAPAEPPERAPLQGGGKDFSLDDFIHFADLNSGKGVESPHSFGKGGFDLDDLFPGEQAQSAEEPPQAEPPAEEPARHEEKKKGLEWLE